MGHEQNDDGDVDKGSLHGSDLGKGRLRVIEEVFSRDFFPGGMRLPPEDVLGRRRGQFVWRGSTVLYLFGEDGRGEYLDFYERNRTSNDHHWRIYEDGHVDRLPAIEDQVIAALREACATAPGSRNGEVRAMLREKGFYPMGGVPSVVGGEEPSAWEPPERSEPATFVLGDAKDLVARESMEITVNRPDAPTSLPSLFSVGVIGSMVIGLLQLSLLGMMIGVQDSSVGLIAVLRVLLTMLFIPATVMLFLASSLCLVLVVFRWSDQEMSHKVGLANLCVAAVLLCIYSAFFVVTQILNV